MAYKQKNKQYIINASKQQPYFCKNDYIVFNLSASFQRKDNLSKFVTNLKEAREFSDKINLCNLSSLCYKLGIIYASQETLDFVKKIIDLVKEQDFKILQNNILNYGEIDMRPFSKLVSYDEEHGIIYTNSVLIDCLKIIGYSDNQLYDIIDFTKDLKQIIPPDLIEELPIETKKTLGCYNMIKEMIC